MDKLRAQQRIHELFGSFRAEWLDAKVFELFKQPSYFPDLITNRPSVLIGGRGTGKTTVLRCMSYEGQFALKGRHHESFKDQRFYGFFYRVDSNRMTAFRGAEQSEETWIKVFGHYLNLTLCHQVAKFLVWHTEQFPDNVRVQPEAIQLASIPFGFTDCFTVDDLKHKLNVALVKFESVINNIADERPQGLTILGAPIALLLEELHKLPQFAGKQFYFLLDEYENFLDYQQRAVNTLIKHVGALYSIMIGVRQFGWRVRDTLSGTEHLTSPADYNRISLADRLEGSTFEEFAYKVCQERINAIDPTVTLDVRNLFPGLSEEDEADLLWAGKLPVWEDECPALQHIGSEARRAFDGFRNLEKYFFVTWPEWKASHKMLRDDILSYSSDASKLVTRYNNYKHSLLFAIRKGKSGIRKHYCGWDVYAKLAAGNIRFFLELIERALNDHLDSGAKWGEIISTKIQTQTAQYIGRKNLEELEGVDVEGAKLTKLLLGLGRVFQVMAASPFEHTPEVNQFQVSAGNATEQEQARSDMLLRLAVNHLALIRLTGSKLSDPGDTRDADYAIHPIYSAFFVFTYRKKRKMTLTCDEFLSLVQQPKSAIHEILGKSNRLPDHHDCLPEQMSLFEGYYA